MLAGRKLLLADDSITIQKVVDLTFSDEGAHVLCVDNGRDAIDVLEKFKPDIVLADVFMPEVNGYEVCEYIKQNEKLKQIPVMLLVGSFEPFDEEEARRVGANEVLTKPFQSIRRLLDKVGLMVGSRPPEEQIPTAELPQTEAVLEPEAEKLSTAELEITTADTQPLPPELQHVVEQSATSVAQEDMNQVNEVPASYNEVPASYEVAANEPLDLGDVAGATALDDDFVLDVDLDEIPEPSPAEPAFQPFAFRSRSQFADTLSYSGTNGSSTAVAEAEPAVNTNELVSQVAEPQVEAAMPAPMPMEAPAVAAARASASELSAEMIDAIAKRVVEQMSEKVVQEIAWEVVPQLAELLIKRQLEEKNS
ncbi:MAG TPA: response regulator [Pyrinomonadaceae bacterium]|nr:response regulator [Pyrinomonadaceae bacterium]